MILCDASALVALISQDDNNHDRCVAILPNLEAPLVTTWLLLEILVGLLGAIVLSIRIVLRMTIIGQ